MSTATISDAATARRCQGTPTITVVNNRGAVVRTVKYNRTASEDALDTLIARQTWSVRGHLDSSTDPRLFEKQRLDPTVPPNFRYVRSLSDQPLTIRSQDAGERTALFDVEGVVVWQQDARGQQVTRTFDTLHRLTPVTEQSGAAAPRVSERFVCGDANASPDANLRGQLFEAWSPAGFVTTPSYNLSGQSLSSQQMFLRDDVLHSDWLGNVADWARDLAPGTFTTRWAYNALGQETERLDACGNRQRQHYNVAGQLAGSDLLLTGQSAWQPLLHAITYSAAGQVLHEEAGNGVVTDYTYELQTQRLAELCTTRPVQAGCPTALQALSYQYDPVGNLLTINDDVKAIRYTRNQRVEPTNHYTYDALYQLTRANGRENANAGPQSQALPPAIVPLWQKSGELTNYTRTYTYDRGNNLTSIQHVGLHPYTQQMVVARTSNRAVPQTDGLTPGDVSGCFDACGNLIELGPGQPLAWDSRNQLQRTTQIVRNGADDDTEVYWYDGSGQRATKLSTALTSGTTRTQRVRYLPGLELRQTEQTPSESGSTSVTEALQVIQFAATGRQALRVLHWEQGQPADIENDQFRYSLDDQLGSSLLEVDQQADILNWEEYYPFGGTAVWSARNDTETQYKFVRYSGKERDATGLYYYGFRYYAPWLGRWLNPDPARTVDGLNLFCMVGNNPTTFIDREGLAATRLDWLDLAPAPCPAKVAVAPRKLGSRYESLPPTAGLIQKVKVKNEALISQALTSQLEASRNLSAPIEPKMFPQLELPTDLIFQLSRIDEDSYILLSPVGESPKIPYGTLSYAIRYEDPLSIYVFEHASLVGRKDLTEKVIAGVTNYGHASLAHKEVKPDIFDPIIPYAERIRQSAKPVLLAGNLNFEMEEYPQLDAGRLVSWSIESGHFRPTNRDAAQNRVGLIRQLLPIEKFNRIDWEAKTKQMQRR
jgi:insecticidal toxin complex protein TccC